jgi:hypothetical protein
VALRAVPDHPKFAELKALLNQPKGPTAGWLEMMWHFAGRFTPQGNIGKYSDLAIESWVEWDGTPGALIAALIQAGWIDRDSTHRLLVHDWKDHADKATKNSLMRAKLPFCTPGVRTEIHDVRTAWQESSTASRLPEPVPVPEPEANTSPIARATPEIPEQPEEEIPDGLADVQYAAAVMLKASIVQSFSLTQKFAQALGIIARDEKCSRPDATNRMLARVKSTQALGDVKWTFWLDDGGWKAERNQTRRSPATVGYLEPPEVEQLGRRIEDKYGNAFGNPPPEEMVAKAKIDNVFSESAVTPEQVLVLLESWKEFRQRQRRVTA